MKGVAVHWTVTPARDDHAACEQDWANVIAQHQGNYNPSPAYNWGACQHGVTFRGRGWEIRSAANGTNEANRDYWAVVALQAPGDVPTSALLTALAGLIDEAPDLESRTVRPHSDFFATACCGDELRAWIAAGAQAPSTPAPLPKEYDDVLILISDNGQHYLVSPGRGAWGISGATSDDLARQGVPRTPVPQFFVEQVGTPPAFGNVEVQFPSFTVTPQ